MSIAEILKDPHEKMLYLMIAGFLGAGGEPGVPFVSKFLARHGLSAADVAPIPKGLPKGITRSLVEAFGARIVEEPPEEEGNIALLAQPDLMAARMKEIREEREEIPLDSIPF